MWDDAKKIYDYAALNDLYVEDLDIQLHVYVFPMTSELLTFCKENAYRIKFSEGTILPYAHYDFTYTDIDSVEWVTNCTEETAFSVGTCAAAGFNFSIFSEKYLDDGTNVTYDKTEFKRAIVIPVYDFYHDNSLIVQKQLGVFHVLDYEKDTDKIDFTCMDNMQFLDKKATGIQKNMSVPLKSYALFGKMLEILNLAEGPAPLIQHFQINEVKHLKKLTYRTILSYMMEALGCYAYADYMGQIGYKCFQASARPFAKIMYEDVMEEKSKGTGVKINGYDIQYGDNAVSAFSYMAEEEVIEVPVPMTVDNPLFIKKKTESLNTIGKRLFDRMYGFSFDPYEVTTFIPNFYIEAGDFVNVQDKYGEFHKILVSQLTWRDNLEMEIVSAYETDAVNGDYDSDVNEAIQRNDNVDSIPADDDSEEEEPEPTVAEFTFDGKDFVCAVKGLAVGSSSAFSRGDYDYTDRYVKNILFTDETPGDNDVKIILGLNSDGHEFIVYASKDNLCGDTVVKMYCDADIVKLTGSMYYMFCNFQNLESIDVSRFDTSDVTDMDSMFLLSNMPSLNLTSFDTANVTTAESMFRGCSMLSEVLVSSEKWTIEPDETNINFSQMFYMSGCSGFTYV